MMPFTRIWPTIGAILWVPAALSQTTLGGLLDAGAERLTPQKFRDEVVQRMTAGPTPTGGMIELLYTQNGVVSGRGSSVTVTSTLPPWTGIDGEWRIDDQQRICTTLRFGSGGGGGNVTLVMPTRCQYWFKLGDKYYFADSDTDRSAKVLVRTIKQ
jgi:hypothetical protein